MESLNLFIFHALFAGARGEETSFCAFLSTPAFAPKIILPLTSLGELEYSAGVMNNLISM